MQDKKGSTGAGGRIVAAGAVPGLALAVALAAAAEPFFLGLGDLPGGSSFSRAWGVSADGSVVVGFDSAAAGFEAFRWTEAGGMAGLGDLPGGSFGSWARSVSADGSTVIGVGHSENGSEAFRWTEAGGMVGLGDPPGGFASEAYGVSADGSVIVGYGQFASGFHFDAFIWDATNGMRSLFDVLTGEFGLDLTGWTLTAATAVSADGLTIVGYGTNPQGVLEAWVASIARDPVSVGEPGSLALLAAGLGGLRLVRRADGRRRRMQ
jgi:probable HAF family extracellular repeat protein